VIFAINLQFTCLTFANPFRELMNILDNWWT